MPIYEYRCSQCNHIFEEWAQHFDSPDCEPCPKCGGKASRIVSNTSFVLKGQGWYVTEYGNKNKSNHESGAGAPGEGAAGSKSDAGGSGDASGKAESAKPEAASSDGAGASSGSSSAAASKGATKAA